MINKHFRPPEALDLLALFVFQVVLALASFWVFGSYFRINVPGSLMFRGNDGWCSIPTESIGNHCFGDFNERVNQNPDDPLFPAWPNNLETSPLGPFISKIGSVASQVLDPRFVLVIFIATYATLMILPIWKATSRFPKRLRYIYVLLLGFASYPVVATLDRLNSVALLAPLMFLYLSGVQEKNKKTIILSVVAMSCIKPQFAIMALVLIPLGHFGGLLLSFSISVASVSFLIVAAGKFDFDRIRQWVEVAVSYSTNFASIERPNPPNASWANVIFGVGKILQASSNQINGPNTAVYDFALQNSRQIALSISVVFIVVAICISKQLSRMELSIVLLATVSLGTGLYVASYYLLFATVVTAIMIKYGFPSSDISTQNSLYSSKFRDWLLVFAVTTSSSLLLVPTIRSGHLNIAGTNVSESLMPTIASFVWMVYCAFVLLSGIRVQAGIISIKKMKFMANRGNK